MGRRDKYGTAVSAIPSRDDLPQLLGSLKRQREIQRKREVGTRPCEAAREKRHAFGETTQGFGLYPEQRRRLVEIENLDARAGFCSLAVRAALNGAIAEASAAPVSARRSALRGSSGSPGPSAHISMKR